MASKKKTSRNYEMKWDQIKPKIEEWSQNGDKVSLLLFKDGEVMSCGYAPPDFGKIKEMYATQCASDDKVSHQSKDTLL